jgi:hypothetical protein
MRHCDICGEDISGSHFNRIYCRPCGKKEYFIKRRLLEEARKKEQSSPIQMIPDYQNEKCYPSPD